MGVGDLLAHFVARPSPLVSPPTSQCWKDLRFSPAGRSGPASPPSGRVFSRSRLAWGVVSGIVMPFQLGTNWSRFSDTTANVLAPLLAYEGLTAFFLESTFLGVLLFGRKLVPAWLHFFSGLMVAAGTLFSTFWILSVNSWMQTPRGFHVANGRFFPDDWMKIIFNPSFPLSVRP